MSKGGGIWLALGGLGLLLAGGSQSRQARQVLDRVKKGKGKPTMDTNGYSLVTVQGTAGRKVQLRNDAAEALAQLQAAARADGIAAPYLLPTSGYRTWDEQAEKFDKAVKKYGSEDAARKWVAKPGYGGHQTGRAVDLWLGVGTAEPSKADKLRETDAFKWLASNAGRFKFFSYEAEPWHWEYGAEHGTVDVAAEIAAGRQAGYLV